MGLLKSGTTDIRSVIKSKTADSGYAIKSGLCYKEWVC